MPVLNPERLNIVPLERHSGVVNMRKDQDVLDEVQRGILPTTLRFYRFDQPTVTYGRLQNPDDVRRLVPPGWPLVQRPTGGGIVLHDQDLCFSLTWRPGHSVIPKKPSEQYQWIHGVIQEALSPLLALARVSCQQTFPRAASFHERQCFQEPVPCDLMWKDQKVVGGALAHRKNGILYQGSIQNLSRSDFETSLQGAFLKHLCPH